MSITKTVQVTKTPISAPRSTSEGIGLDENQMSFPISQLPPELRHEIYASYFNSLPPIEITPSNSTSHHYLSNPLALASPFFASDISSNTFYSSSTFTFSSGKAMRDFSAQYRNSEIVKKIKIVYGKEKGVEEAKNRDWVYLMNACFERLEEVTCEIEVKGDADCFGAWWSCVRDAAREGWCCKRGNVKGKALVLRYESEGQEIAREVVIC